MPDMTLHKPVVGIGRRGFLTAGAALALASASAGCASRSSALQTGIEKPHLTVGAIQAVTASGLYLAQQQGFFTAEGLAVTIEPTTGSGPVMVDLLNGRLDVSFGNYVSFIAAQAHGVAKLRILVEGNNATVGEQQIMVLPNSSIRSVAQLRGATIGVNALANVATLVVSSILAENGVPPSSVRFVAIPFPQMGEALATRRIDAAWLVEPFLTEAGNRYGAQPIADGDQGTTANLPISGYVVTEAWARHYPRTAAAFVRALSRGQRLADLDRSAVEHVLPRYIGVSREVAALVVTGDFPSGVNRVQIQRVADLMHQFGVLKTSFNVAPMIG